MDNIEQITERAKVAATELANLDTNTRNKVLNDMARSIESNKNAILEANAKDLRIAKVELEKGAISEALFNRLALTESKLGDIVKGLENVSQLPDPLNVIHKATELDKDLELRQITTPIGVIAVIFESRPDALPQIVSLAMKTSNAVLLKGGKEAQNSLEVLFECLRSALSKNEVPADAINLLNTREDVQKILSANGKVDLIIPRGSNELVKHIQDNTRIPVLGHADGICHLYVHEDADIEMASKLTIDSKTQYPSACNALETLLIHKDVLDKFLSRTAKELIGKSVELRLDEPCFNHLSNSGLDSSKLKRASDADWETEYCDLILSIKVVENLNEAIEHINRHGSHHTDCLVSRNKEVFDQFFKSVDSAGVFWNASTRFADGYRFGFGAEVGIATGKLHPRGPVGLDGLVTYKYKLEGSGQTVDQYSGSGSKKFLHKNITS